VGDPRPECQGDKTSNIIKYFKKLKNEGDSGIPSIKQ
jgi:hypothetical protein